ncbi:MAG: ROK family protein, partial [Vicinamibacterales bacterium]
MHIGIDLGGTKIEGLALDGTGRELARERLATPRGDYAATIAAIARLVFGLERIVGATGTVGIGMPGIVSPITRLVKNANSTWLNGQPFDRDLEAALGRPVRLANDANCFALSEAVDGAGAGAAVVFGVIVGTGTGGGIVVSGEVVRGANAIGGEWGHNPLPWPEPGEWPGPACYCGRTGCIETFLSGPGLERDHRDVTGERLDAPTLVDRAARGEPHAAATMARYEARMARALASVINLLDPDVIVLGG